MKVNTCERKQHQTIRMIVVVLVDSIAAGRTKSIDHVDHKKSAMPSPRNDGMKCKKARHRMTLSSCSSNILQLRKILPPSFGIGEWKERVLGSTVAFLVP